MANDGIRTHNLLITKQLFYHWTTLALFRELMMGLEPITYWLLINCSANWATSALLPLKFKKKVLLKTPNIGKDFYFVFWIRPQGVEPCVIGYKPIPQNRRGRAAYNKVFTLSSHERTRTSNPAVNSRLFYHWTTWEYIYKEYLESNQNHITLIIKCMHPFL